MTAPWMFRSLAAALFALCVGLATLPGCGNPAPKDDKKNEKKDEKKGETKPDTTSSAGGGTTTPAGPSGPPKSTLGTIEPAADKAATDFRRDLVQGVAKAETLSAAFLKTVGKPLLFGGDKEKGYSASEAASWLKRATDGAGFGPEMTRPLQAGDVVFLRGALLHKPGGYCLRLVKEGAEWKVDWLSLSSVDPAKIVLPMTPTPEGTAQEFALAAFLETITADPRVYPATDRAPLAAAALTPALRTAWAEPFGSDKDEGRDYNVGKVGVKMVEIGGGTVSFTATRVSDQPEFKVELTKPTGKKSYTVKLTKGAGPNDWLVSEITEMKVQG